MPNPWLAILSNLPLSRMEREVVRRFEQDPAGRSFLPVADILRAHRLIDESLELLSQGVSAHPGFTVARVVLARELLQKGLVEQGWRTLEDAPTPLKDNLLAQKLRLKMALLLGYEDEARATATQLEQGQIVDPDTKRLTETLKAYGASEARQRLLREFEERGVALSLPEAQVAKPAPLPDQSAAASLNGDFGGFDEGSDPRLNFAMPSPDAASSPLLTMMLDEGAVQGFHVVPLAEIFRPDGGSEGPSPIGAEGGKGIELDSTTLAEIYARQGHYAKALAVYRRLLQMAPGNELLRRKVAELSQLEKERQDVDLTVDPALIDRLETVEILDRQIRFLSELLAKLS